MVYAPMFLMSGHSLRASVNSYSASTFFAEAVELEDELELEEELDAEEEPVGFDELDGEL